MKPEEAPPSLKEDQVLRAWFSGQSEWKSWRALSDALKIPYSSLRKYVHGRPIRIPEHRARIHRLTGIETFRPDSCDDERMARPGLPTGEEDKKTKLAIQLRQWFSQQAKFRSIAEIARSIGIADSTLGDYFTGRSVPTPRNLSKLRGATQLNVLDEISEAGTSHRGKRRRERFARDAKNFLSRLDAVKRSFASLADEFESLVKEVGKHPEAGSREAVDQTLTGRSRTIAELLARLRVELEFFKAGSAEDREAFRRAIPGEQLGYVVSLLKALYDEEAFREWLHFSRLDLTEKP